MVCQDEHALALSADQPAYGSAGILMWSVHFHQNTSLFSAIRKAQDMAEEMDRIIGAFQGSFKVAKEGAESFDSAIQHLTARRFHTDLVRVRVSTESFGSARALTARQAQAISS